MLTGVPDSGKRCSDASSRADEARRSAPRCLLGWPVPVRAPWTRWARQTAAAAASLFLALLAAGTAGADDPGTLRSEAERLSTANSGLAAESQQALLELYSLETRLDGAEHRLAALEARTAEVERLEASARERLRLARRNAEEAERRLASRLQTLYVEGDVDPLAVLLGAESFDEALTAFDGLGRVAADDRAIVARVRESRQAFERTLRELSARRAELRGLVAGARSARDAFTAARDERVAYLARLHSQETLNSRLIDRLLAQAAAAEEKTREIAPVPVSESTPAPAASGTRMTVSSTGYCLRGTTATGMQVGWGTVAVDPAVIPLGTKMSVPGYGDGVAADTGAAVQGHMIDLWFPSCAQALGWGRRVVTITLK
jgi:3D (Asp-Asp-Asp) domain-containing protein/septal ring factor EnvC (AmiA/AmiB activator)